eukprot:CAMPEP_0174864496 /NCGR_PEP_ID=MMETSP1114-20130205/58557_1 /TAXON_ID=312471 /ORGANISM="Neobodo designis, Strain CCAP 1951/1" /LENGTH=104 /DNA_ID=CAMNT_0016099603 /DNA_START=129 /DNA_END=442 /DNA_ORIENTATION=-
MVIPNTHGSDEVQGGAVRAPMAVFMARPAVSLVQRCGLKSHPSDHGRVEEAPSEGKQAGLPTVNFESDQGVEGERPHQLRSGRPSPAYTARRQRAAMAPTGLDT